MTNPEELTFEELVNNIINGVPLDPDFLKIMNENLSELYEYDDEQHDKGEKS